MFHRPEKVLQIGVHDPLPTALNLLPNFAHGVFRRSPSPISEVGFIEYRLEDRFQPIEQRLLACPVVNRRDSQRAKLARFSRLRDLYLPHRLGPVDIVLQFPVQSIQLLIERSEEHTSELQSRRYLHSFPTRRSSDLTRPVFPPSGSVPAAPVGAGRHRPSVPGAIDPTADRVARRILPDSARPHLHYPRWP